MSDSLNSYLANLGDVTVEQISQRDHPAAVALDGKQIEPRNMMDGRQTVNEEEDNSADTDDARRKKISPNRSDDMEEMRAEGSADDMELDETIDSRIGMRMESQRQHIRAVHSEEEDEEDDDGIDAVNILDSLPLEGAPIEGQEVSEAFLLGKEDDEDEAEEKSSGRSSEADNLEAGKRIGEHDDNLDPVKKKQKKEDGSESNNDADNDKKMDKKTANMRRNIREVMDETQLDEATLAAQRQEMERLRRVQEQQRIIREVQRRQISKGTSLLRSNLGVEEESEVRLPSSVQLKVNSNLSTGGQVSVTQQSNVAPRRPMAESCRWPKGGRGGFQGSQTSISRVPVRGNVQSNAQQRIRMMTPSVSISPVVSKKESVEHLEYYTDSDLSDVDGDFLDADESMIADKQMMQARKLSSAGKTMQKAGKGKDVVTISSSSESSDDDCIVLSDPSDTEETDNDEDPTNSGMHTNDRYNIPDEKGRVLVNVGHPEDEPDVFLAPQIARIIKPHQIGGIRFLYDNIVESIERYKTSTGFGCILAHSMGLGKTLQVASFCDILFRCTDAKTVLCIMPINTLQNWLAEFNMWLPYEDPNKSKVEDKANIKEESNQSDLGYMSRQSSEQDSSSQHTPAPTMTPETPPYPPPHPSYNQTYNPYAPAGSMYDPRYGASYTGYKPDPYGMPQYNYPPPPPPPPLNYQDPHAPYPSYGAPYPGYISQPRPEVPLEVKKENLPPPEETQVKTEPMDESNKKSDELKKDDKDNVTVKTPFIVDAPADMEVRPRHFSLHILNDSHKTMAARARVIREWQKIGGVLLIGYELYRQLSLKKPNKAKRKRGQPFKDPIIEDDDKNKPLLDEMHTALVNPGPDLVICDEGHRIKNSHASISMALKQMRTKRRIVLTGYPLQNNLLEYWCMVDFVRPNYLGTKSEFCNMFERPIQNGQCIDSTPQDIRLMRYRAHVLHSLLLGFVQRRSHSVLQVSLPRKEEYILLVRMTPHQRKLYDTFMNTVVKTRAVPNPLKAFAVCCKIWNHPDVLYHFLKKRQANEEDDLDLEETMGDKATTAASGAKRTPKARVPKGEGKKGKKASPKNKPAASVQPNSSAMSSDNGEGEEQKSQGFQNFNAPPPPLAQGTAYPQQQQQNNYQQQQDGYQNYQGGEYNNYYGNQNQQSYPTPNSQNQQLQPSYPATGNQSQHTSSSYPAPGSQSQQAQQSYPSTGSQIQQNQQQTYPPLAPTGTQTQQPFSAASNQNFPAYTQNSNYSSSNQTQPSQQYQGQSQQNYNDTQRFPGPSTLTPSPSPSTQNYRPEQNHQVVTTPGTATNYPRSSYPYQSPENRNYQGQNYSQTPVFQNQQPNQMGTWDQGYDSTPSQTVQNYPAATQQQQQQQQPQQQQQQQPQQQQPQQQTTSNSTTTNYPANQPNPGSYSQSSSTQTNQQYSTSATQHQTYASSTTQPYVNPTAQPPNQQYSSTNTQTTPSYTSSTPQIHQPYTNTPAQNSQQQREPTQLQNQSHSYTATQSATSNSTTASSMTYNSNQAAQQQQQQQQQPNQQPQAYQSNPVKGAYQNQTSNYAPTQVPSTPTQQSQFAYSNPQQQQHQPTQQYQQQPMQQQNPPQQYQQPPVQQTQPQQQYQQQPVQQTQQQQQYQQQPMQQPQQQQQYQQQTAQQPQQQQQYQQQPVQQPQQQQQYQQQPAQQPQQQQQQQQYQQQPHNYNQQNTVYPPTSQQSQQTPQQSSIGYQQNQSGSTSSSAQTTYGYQSQPNQSVQHSQNYQQPAQTIKTEPLYDYPSQGGNNYSSVQNNSTPMPAANQTPNSQQQQQPATQGQNQYWQGNYQNSNDPYYNQSTNQYQTNYQGNASNNYQTNQQSQEQNQYQNYPTDSKPPQSNVQNESNVNPRQVSNNVVVPYNNSTPIQTIAESSKVDDINKIDQEKDKLLDKDKDKEDKSDDEAILKDETDKDKCSPGGFPNSMNAFKDQEPGIPYDWATELMKGYVPGLIDASAKMTVFFCILEEAIRLGDRVLAFSQSLFTLNLIEDFLARNDFKYSDGKTESWAKNTNYYRLDGSTSALEREKLINEFNANPKIHLFLVSTRAGSLGINLVGANRAIVFDASWNPCHDTQAVCRVYRYGQKKNCYVYRLVTDNCLERKIYDRQISKQGMSDRVVDQCNPDAHLSLKEATTLNWDWEEDSDPQDFSNSKDKFPDEVMHIVLEKHSTLLTKQPFHHESLLVDRKDKKLSQAEKRLARRGYELEKMAATSSRPSYNYVPGNTAARVSVQSGSLQIRQIRDGPTPKPVASVRPMQQRGAEGLSRNPGGSRWIPAEVWQRQGMSAQEMTLPLDVVIPTNSPDKGSIVLKAGQRVMVLKSPKGIYMQLESGKIIAIRTALKVNQKKDDEPPKKGITPVPIRNNANKGEVSFPLRNNSAISIIPKSSTSNVPIPPTRPMTIRTGVNYRPFGEKEVVNRRKSVATAAAKPYNSQFNTNQVSVSRINKSKHDDMGDNSNSSDGHKVRPEQRVEEVRIEDVVSEKGSNSEYSPASSRLSSSDTDTNLPRPLMERKRSPNFPLDISSSHRSHSIRTPPYVSDPKMNMPRKLEMNRPKERKNDGSEDIIIDDSAKRLHQPFQPYQQHPTRPQPRPAAPRAETSKPTQISTPSKSSAEVESQPLSGYPYAQYPRYYDYTDPRTRPLADPYGSYFSPVAKPTEEKPKSSTDAASFPRPTKEPSQTNKSSDTTSTSSNTAPVREDPHGPTAFSHPSSVRPAYPPGPYPPYDPYAQHYPAPASSAAYSSGAAAAAAAYPAYGTPTYNADYARMYPAFPPPPPTATDPYRTYAPPPPSTTGHPPPPPPSNYYAPFPHPPPPPYPNYSFLPPYPNPGVSADPQPPAP